MFMLCVCVCCTVRTKGISQENQDKETSTDEVQTENEKKIPLRVTMFVCFVCCACASCSLVQMSPIGCVCLFVCDLETSSMRSSRTDLDCCDKKNGFFGSVNDGGLPEHLLDCRFRKKDIVSGPRLMCLVSFTQTSEMIIKENATSNFLAHWGWEDKAEIVEEFTISRTL